MRFMTIKKILLPMAVCAALLASLCVGGTLAYLTDFEGSLKNAFTIGDVNVSLSETDTALDGDDDTLTNAYAITEGGQLKDSIAKDPKVTVSKGSADCWVFVRLEENDTFDDLLGYEMADGWITLDENLHPGVFYREVPEGNGDQIFSVLRDDLVTVDADTSLEEVRNYESNAATRPTLEVTAYAAQKSGITDAATAWELVGE